MNKLQQVLLLMALSVLMSVPGFAQAAKDDPARIATRDHLAKLLITDGPKINVSFTQSLKNPFNFVGHLSNGLKTADEMEIIISVTNNSTIGFRIYPHYKKGYINVDKAKDAKGLMKKLLQFSDTNFLFWGADDTDDVFAGYTITLESGLPEEVVDVVVRSIPNQDQYVGQLLPFVDGTPAPKT